MRRNFSITIEPDDCWIGVFRGAFRWYVCIIPCVVISFNNRHWND